ncbi:programmed cell death protein 2 [Melia azedarach]|uniref:Programmed cell death protein 2 n=1 Tax=Melia azedarach TaxID=155640 RepID=A0ACC1YYR4_MELAZ|nr:programmed cell death protein 2 [Melia azedarach]
MDGSVKGDPIEELKELQITSLDDDDDEEREQEMVTDEYEDDDDDEEDEEEQEPVTLGFIEKPKNSWSLLRHLFPSKAGGSPAWLDPINIPSGRSCLCDMCGEPLHFVLQVYAPIVEKESAFHRTLFLFMCPSMACLLRDQHEQWKRPPEKTSRSVKVFRCQLPHSNPFYSSEAPKCDGTDKPSGPGVSLCNWCGTWKGDKVCSSCRKAHYCSQKHQVVHWRSGHKIECQQLNLFSPSFDSNHGNGETTSAQRQKVASNSLWPEYEMINEDESEYDTEMSEYNGQTNALVSKTRVDDTMKSLLSTFEGDSDRKSWATFQERIAKAPDQVLRYCRSASAKGLWPMSGGRPSKADIPKCSYCSGPRCFEFQILPQLLYYFGVKNDVDSLDWATIVVYTCEASCEASVGYKEEFVWVQHSSQSVNVP